MKKQLHPGALWLFRVRGFLGSLIFLWVISWVLYVPLRINDSMIANKNPAGIFALGAGIIIAYFAVVIIIMEIYARMSYKRWNYEFADNNLSVERGIIWKKYSNIPYERVQNVDIQRGIIARLFGFSAVHIQTAGYSYSSKRGGWAEGYLPAIASDEAEKIRTFLMKKIGRKQGL